MWRILRVAYAGQSNTTRSNLAGLLARLGLQETIDDIGGHAGAVKNHVEDPFEIIFIDGLEERERALSLAKELRAVSTETSLVLVVESLADEDAAAAINEARIDWILQKSFSEVELKGALLAATKKLDAFQAWREMQLGRNVLRVTKTPAVILNRNYQLIFANKAANALFGQGDPFHLTKDAQLVCNTPSESQGFHEELRGSLHKHLQNSETAFIRVNRTDERKPVIALSIPKREAIDSRYTYHIVFNDLERQTAANAEDFAVALGISTSEARLAQALVRGLDLEEASSLINISVNTARSYLKSIFEKTGVTRQAELVRIALLAVH